MDKLVLVAGVYAFLIGCSTLLNPIYTVCAVNVDETGTYEYEEYIQNCVDSARVQPIT